MSACLDIQPKIISYDNFETQIRDAVLLAIDMVTHDVMQTNKVDGWKDHELKVLFAGVDAHARTLANRINAGNEINSAYVRIDMQRGANPL